MINVFAIALAAPAGLPPVSLPSISVGGELVRVVLGLLGIIAMILAAGWLTRRLQARTAPGGRRIRCIETLSVGARDRVLLLEANGKRLLVGVGQGGMRTLHVYDGEIVTAQDDAAGRAVAPMPGFADVLNRWKRKP